MNKNTTKHLFEYRLNTYLNTVQGRQMQITLIENQSH